MSFLTTSAFGVAKGLVQFLTASWAVWHCGSMPTPLPAALEPLLAGMHGPSLNQMTTELAAKGICTPWGATGAHCGAWGVSLDDAVSGSKSRTPP